MSYVISAWWTAKPGNEDEIVGIIEAMSARSREEPGCLAYQAHLSSQSTSTFFLYERYADEEAFRAHVDSEHYRRLVEERALPLLEERSIERYETLEDSEQLSFRLPDDRSFYEPTHPFRHMLFRTLDRATGMLSAYLRKSSDELTYLRYVDDRHRRGFPDKALMLRTEYDEYLTKEQKRNPQGRF